MQTKSLTSPVSPAATCSAKTLARPPSLEHSAEDIADDAESGSCASSIDLFADCPSPDTAQSEVSDGAVTELLLSVRSSFEQADSDPDVEPVIIPDPKTLLDPPPTASNATPIMGMVPDCNSNSDLNANAQLGSDTDHNAKANPTPTSGSTQLHSVQSATRGELSSASVQPLSEEAASQARIPPASRVLLLRWMDDFLCISVSKAQVWWTMSHVYQEKPTSAVAVHGKWECVAVSCPMNRPRSGGGAACRWCC